MKKRKPEAPAPDRPPDWFHHHAKQAERLDRLEARLRAVEDRTGITQGITSGSPETAVQEGMEGRYVHPAGVVPPHVQLNLRALLEWTDVSRYRGANAEAFLPHLQSLVRIALEGGDVPRP